MNSRMISARSCRVRQQKYAGSPDSSCKIDERIRLPHHRLSSPAMSCPVSVERPSKSKGSNLIKLLSGAFYALLLVAQITFASVDCLPTNGAAANGPHTLAFEARPSARHSLAQRLLLDHPSQRNRELLLRLTRGQLDYQILYPSDDDDDGEVAINKRADNRPEAEDKSSFEAPEVDLVRPRRQQQQSAGSRQTKTNQVLGHYNRTNVVIKAFNYKFRLDLELNNNLFGPSLIQKHFLPKGNQQISTQKIEHCYYHARTQSETRPSAVGAFRTCNGLSGIIYANNESFVIHPFYDADFSRKHPHIIYRYQTSLAAQQTSGQTTSTNEDFPDSGDANESLTPGEQHQTIVRECGNTKLHEWALRQYNRLNQPLKRSASSPQRQQLEVDLHSLESNQFLDAPVKADKCPSGSDNGSPTCDKAQTVEGRVVRIGGGGGGGSSETPAARFSKRDVSLTEKYIELGLVLNQDMFDKRNSSSRLEVVHDAIQIINCLDLYFRSANTRVALVYLETWAHGDQIEISSNVKQTLYNFLGYYQKKLYNVHMDAVHLLTGGHLKQFDSNEVGMSIPDSVCTSSPVSISQESSIFEPFIAASTIAHMLGHSLGMEHDVGQPETSSPSSNTQEPLVTPSTTTTTASIPVDQGPGRSEQIPRQKPEVLQFATGHPVVSRPLTSGSTAHSTTGSPAVGRPSQRQSSAGHRPDQEEHDDEIKSRSLVEGDGDFEMGSPKDPSGRDPYLASSSNQVALPSPQHCRHNCLMSQRFTYLQPPVSFGNMVQQQVATSSNHTSSSLSGFVTSDNNQVADRQQQQHSGHLNGFTMNQIDKELQSESLLTAILPFRFSRRSLDTYHRLLRIGHGICLFNKPGELQDFKTCGNGIVDRGEDCDCGTFQECLESDSCCDPVTCRFRADAECINGACCDRCRFRPRGFVCRKSRGECDLAELCDGRTSQCAPDVHKQNGYPCAQGAGYCYLGQCPAADQQCAELWGLDARESDRLCYAGFNLNGTIRGNCGYDQQARKYRRCEPEHMMCGTLQCQLGDMKPVTAPIDLATVAAAPLGPQPTVAYEFSKKTLHAHDGAHHECKVITGPVGQQQQPPSGGGGVTGFAAASISYVRDGSKCAPNKVCFNFTCQPLESAYREAFELCPRDEKGRLCSGNGLCSTANRCHCDEGWLGHDCSQRGDSAKQTSSTPTADDAPSNQISPPSAAAAAAEVVEQIAQHQDAQPASPTTKSDGSISDEQSTTARVASNPLPALSSVAASIARPTERNIVIMPPGGGGLLPLASAPLVPPRSQPEPATATPEPATTTGAPPAAPQPAVHQDKKKHDALGAPTLVFILVSIVAAVYVGFAIMANCYRRKGFLKPDKVLRHHQMNCKLDAIRSSFIAKRLADAAGLGILEPGGDPPVVPGGGHLEVDLMNSSSFAGPPASTCQHMQPLGSGGATVYNMSQQQAAGLQLGPAHLMGSYDPLGGELKSFVTHPSAGPYDSQQKSGAPPGRPGGQFAATVHYFDEAGGRPQQDAHECVHQQRPQQLDGSFGFEHLGDSADHIPLLMGTAADKATSQRGQNRTTINQPILRSLNGGKPSANYKNAALLYQTGNQWATGGQHHNTISHHGHHHHRHHHHHHPKHQQQVAEAGQEVDGLRPRSGLQAQTQLINRATSLGNVNGCQRGQSVGNYSIRHPDSKSLFESGEVDEAHRRAHRALATPSRARGALLAGPTYHYQRRSPVEDSCSAPSSPEHRAPYWSDAERHKRPYMGPSRQSSSSIFRAGPASYHEDVILDALAGGGQQITPLLQRQSLGNVHAAAGRRDQLLQLNDNREDEEEDEEDLPPLPPPPPPSASRLLNEEPGSEEDSGQSMQHTTASNQQQLHRNRANSKRQSEPTLPQSPIAQAGSWSMRTIKRIPLNSGDSDEPPEQLSLIEQLQHLERVQSLHQKQVSSSTTGRGKANKSSTGSESLHEFFSLPLSVQLSALLTRSLQESRADGVGSLEDYLNTLNSTNVAASSRRSFKNWSTSSSGQQQSAVNSVKEQQASGIWGHGASKRHQMKLHNLQGLIMRLQKLHSQTMLQQQQQQLDESSGELNEDLMGRGGRHSTLSRSNHTRPSHRGKNQPLEDLHANGDFSPRLVGAANSTETRRSNSRASRYNPRESKNDSIYSMSDSEDGAFVSRVFTSYRKTDDKEGHEKPDQTAVESTINNQSDTDGSRDQANDEQSVGSTASSSEVNSCVGQRATIETKASLADGNEKQPTV